MKRRFITLCLATMSAVTVFAAPIGLTKATTLATNFFKSNLPQTRADAMTIALAWTDAGDATRADETGAGNTLYIYTLNATEGFIVLAGDDAVYPVLGYSLEKAFDPQNIPVNMRAWLDGYRQQIEYVRENDIQTVPEIQKAWENLTHTRAQVSTRATRFYTAEWNQTEPFNNLCPTISGTRAPTGCVATAMAIIMKHHNWPDVGVGSSSYKATTVNQTLSATYNVAYDWAGMPLEYDTYTPTQATNVATLMYHCGVLAEMDYKKDESGASTITALQGMVNHLKYDKSAQLLWREWYDDNTWTALIKNEIDNNRPVLYAGANANNEGHQFVLEGYNDSDYFAVNWGWGGLGNAHYLLKSLNPSVLGTGGGSGGFNYSHDAAIGLKPAEVVSQYEDVLAFYPGDGDDNEYFNGMETTETEFTQGKSFSIKAGFMMNFSMRDFNGLFALTLCSEDGTVRDILSDHILPVIDMKYQNGTGGTFACTMPANITVNEGDRIRMLYISYNSAAEVRALVAGGSVYINPDDFRLVMGCEGTVWELNIHNIRTDIAPAERTAGEMINVTGNQVTISSDEAISRIEIYDLQGRMIEQTKPAASVNEAMINISGYPTGTYILKMKTAKGVVSRKFIKF